jgi:hypothetical protein
MVSSCDRTCEGEKGEGDVERAMVAADPAMK